jgi:lipopolysaccharide biosynthesis glycosyltransferase
LSLLETNKKNKIKIYILSSILPKGNIDELKRIVNLYNQKIEFIITNNIVPKELKEVMINKNSSA